MTLEVSAHYQQQWDTQVRLRLQARGNMLGGTVMPPVRIEGNKFHFLRSGTLNATKWGGRGHQVQVQGSVDDMIEIESDEWDCSYYLYDRDKWMVPGNEAATRQQQSANALGRQADAIIYDAIMAAPIPNENIIGNYTRGLDPYLLLEAEAKLFEQFTPNDGGIFAPVPARHYQRLSTFARSGSSDWIGGDLPLTKMTKARTYGSIHVFQFEHQHAVKYTSGTQLRMRIWHKECVGAGYTGERQRTEWERQATFKRWQVIPTLDGAARVIEPNGIVELRLKADALIEDEVQRTQAVA
jgi:Phage capsid protein